MSYRNVFQFVDVNSAVLVTASVLVVGYVCTCLRTSREPTTPDTDGKPRRRVLLITAHPDDECMFFGPTVRQLTNTKDVRLYLMCLSVGNAPVPLLVSVDVSLGRVPFQVTSTARARCGSANCTTAARYWASSRATSWCAGRVGRPLAVLLDFRVTARFSIPGTPCSRTART